jgi:regulator of replication initiation timing
LYQEIGDLEAIHQQVERRREKMLRMAKLQKKIDKAAEEMRHITQDNEQGHKPQQRDLCQESPSLDDIWYADFHHDNIAFDDASP